MQLFKGQGSSHLVITPPLLLGSNPMGRLHAMKRSQDDRIIANSSRSSRSICCQARPTVELSDYLLAEFLDELGV